ncbi:MAG: MBL fold metallo-hydrolase [Bacteroidota bacterium]
MSWAFTFLGTGTSQGVPVISCTCEVCQSVDPRDKRLRTSGLLRVGETTLVFDAGPDFRQQMLREKVSSLDAVIFTHQHKDHTAGLDDVRAYNYLQDRRMPVYGTAAVLEHLRKEYYYIFDHGDYPGLPKLDLKEIDPHSELVIDGVRLIPIPLMHGRMPVLGYRYQDFAYLTDTNFIPEASFEKLTGVKTLVIDALRREPHYSHFSLAESLAAIASIQPERAYLIHLSHLMGRHEEVEKELPAGVRLGYDGLRLGPRVED